MSLLDKEVAEYLRSPNPIWNLALAKKLRRAEMTRLIIGRIIDRPEDYNTTSIFLNNGYVRTSIYKHIKGASRIELPDFQYLRNFYIKHCLKLLDVQHFKNIGVYQQVVDALELLEMDINCGLIVRELVKSIQILSQPEPEYDISYSHPEIPFTIFVSIGKKLCDLDIIRLAESILHEAMHLNLSLMERRLPLINDNSKTFFSPWRDEERPLRGVLHALFVFSAIRSWYKKLLLHYHSFDEIDFISYRIECIEREIGLIRSFPQVQGLTLIGSDFVQMLIKHCSS